MYLYVCDLQIKRVKDADEVPMVCKYTSLHTYLSLSMNGPVIHFFITIYSLNVVKQMLVRPILI